MTPADTKKVLSIGLALLVGRKVAGSGQTWGDWLQGVRSSAGDVIGKVRDNFGAWNAGADGSFAGGEVELAGDELGTDIWGGLEDARIATEGR